MKDQIKRLVKLQTIKTQMNELNGRLKDVENKIMANPMKRVLKKTVPLWKSNKKSIGSLRGRYRPASP